ncbi:ATP-binding protein [Paracoccus siganidrum]|uniref:ATP-binding protein n=1 Tax=Paracoccus siganidrum TaxID=1276757 RepID=UPI0016052843|nr:ATP-binding protein [Paracoccus siganidrum]
MPSEVRFDFSPLRFASPSGIVLLHNLTRFLVSRDIAVSYENYARQTEALRFIDDIGFFADHLGHHASPLARHRPTTCRLKEVHHQRSYEWIDGTFLPWFSNCANRPIGALAQLRVCLTEIFNNIRDHSSIEVGSIFAQWYPNKEELRLSVGDFGRGIPKNVWEVDPSLTPSQAIIRAFEPGFSTRGNPRNRGAGLGYLRDFVTEQMGGNLTLYSGGAAVYAGPSTQVTAVNVNLGNSGYTGTLVDINVPTVRIESVAPEAEDNIW